jgi:serine phosphatase RsbU (regulator of sigma subunit)
MRSKLPQRVWQILLWLSPLAFLAGLTLYYRYGAEMQVPFHVERQQAIAIARHFAATKGIDATAWESYAKTEANNTRHFYYRIKGEEAVARIRPLAPIATIQVLLNEPQRRQNLEVILAPDGRVIGYKRNFAEGGDVSETEEVAAQARAAATLRARPEAEFIPANAQPTRAEDRSSGVVVRHYTWRWTPAQTPELEGKTTISVRGEQVTGEILIAELESQYTQRIFGQGSLPAIIAMIIYVLLALVVVIFGIFRFTERLRQKEVSYARLLVIALAVAATFGGFMFQTDVAVYDAASNLRLGELAYLNNIFGFMTWLLIGLLLGFAYCSGEGDLRELYPGKLTSLDALLTGKLQSRNVAQAVVHGTALSGWLLLLTQLLVAAFSSQPGAGWRIASLEPYMASWPWLVMLLNWPSFGVLSVIFTLLLPLPLLQRRLQNRRWILLLLFLIACESTVITTTQTIRPWTVALLATMLAAATMLVAFFKFDVLTAILALSVADLATFSLLLIAQPAPGLHRSGIVMLTAALLALVLALYFYGKGRLYHEDAVRPQYASNLAERLSLQAEVSAAREAQIRLLPDKLPEIRQLAVAAVCQPAHEVGGDFYDLFELEQGKLGIFMAEGGGRGLAAALTIAFAKGFLMPKIKHETMADNSPTEIVRSLQTQFFKTMAQDEVSGFIYAVIDPSDKTLRYAGTGNFPRPHIQTQTNHQTAEEHQIKFQLQEEKKFQVTEGIQYLTEGDMIALLSDSAAQLIHAEQQQTFWQRLRKHAESSYRLRDALQDALQEGQRHQPEVKDDLTAVIVTLKQTGGSR